jgi:hypothetical protein
MDAFMHRRIKTVKQMVKTLYEGPKPASEEWSSSSVGLVHVFGRVNALTRVQYEHMWCKYVKSRHFSM